MGATDHQGPVEGPVEALAYLRDQGTAQFELAYAWDEPSITPGALGGVGVADFAGPRTRVVKTIVPPDIQRRLARGRPRNPVRRLFRRGLVALNTPTEHEYDEGGRLRTRAGPGEAWEDFTRLLDDPVERQGDPLGDLTRSHEKWWEDRSTPAELTVASCDPPDDPATRVMWTTLRFHNFGVPFEEPDLWALYAQAVAP